MIKCYVVMKSEGDYDDSYQENVVAVTFDEEAAKQRVLDEEVKSHMDVAIENATHKLEYQFRDLYQKKNLFPSYDYVFAIVPKFDSSRSEEPGYAKSYQREKDKYDKNRKEYETAYSLLIQEYYAKQDLAMEEYLKKHLDVSKIKPVKKTDISFFVIESEMF